MQGKNGKAKRSEIGISILTGATDIPVGDVIPGFLAMRYATGMRLGVRVSRTVPKIYLRRGPYIGRKSWRSLPKVILCVNISNGSRPRMLPKTLNWSLNSRTRLKARAIRNYSCFDCDGLNNWMSYGLCLLFVYIDISNFVITTLSKSSNCWMYTRTARYQPALFLDKYIAAY